MTSHRWSSASLARRTQPVCVCVCLCVRPAFTVLCMSSRPLKVRKYNSWMDDSLKRNIMYNVQFQSWSEALMIWNKWMTGIRYKGIQHQGDANYTSTRLRMLVSECFLLLMNTHTKFYTVQPIEIPLLSTCLRLEMNPARHNVCYNQSSMIHKQEERK